MFDLASIQGRTEDGLVAIHCFTHVSVSLCVSSLFNAAWNRGYICLLILLANLNVHFCLSCFILHANHCYNYRASDWSFTERFPDPLFQGPGWDRVWLLYKHYFSGQCFYWQLLWGRAKQTLLADLNVVYLLSTSLHNRHSSVKLKHLNYTILYYIHAATSFLIFLIGGEQDAMHLQVLL